MRTGRTTTSLPKGKTLEDYDKPSMVGRASKAPKDLREAMDKVFSGVNVIKVPETRKQSNFIIKIRLYLARRNKEAKICKIGTDELYIRLKE